MVSGPNFTVIMVCIMLIKHLLECFMIVYVIFSAKCNSFKLNFPAHGYYLMPYKALSPINTVGTTLKAYCFSILQRSNFFSHPPVMIDTNPTTPLTFTFTLPQHDAKNMWSQHPQVCNTWTFTNIIWTVKLNRPVYLSLWSVGTLQKFYFSCTERKMRCSLQSWWFVWSR